MLWHIFDSHDKAQEREDLIESQSLLTSIKLPTLASWKSFEKLEPIQLEHGVPTITNNLTSPHIDSSFFPVTTATIRISISSCALVAV